MTNNPTIDGVSRATIDRIADLLSKVQMFKESTEVRAILDAPAVERQEPVAYRVTYNDGEKGPWLNGAPIELDKSDVADGVIRAVECAYAIPTDSAALQSTIARLEARVAELESGRGERVKTPDMPYKMLPLEEDGWFQCVNAYEAMYPLFTAPPAPVAQIIDEQQAFANWTHEVIGMRGLAKVQRRDEMTVEQEKFALKGWLARACLDATAALNEPAK